MLAPALVRAQSTNASLSGTVTDPTGATIPDAKLTLTSEDTATVSNFTTTPNGLYTFGNLTVGTYDLQVMAKGLPHIAAEGHVTAVGAIVPLSDMLLPAAVPAVLTLTSVVTPVCRSRTKTSLVPLVSFMPATRSVAELVNTS